MKLANRLLVLLLSAAVLAATVIGMVEVVVSLMGRDGWLIDRTAWHGWMVELRWDEPALLWTSIGLALAGLLLVAFQLKPRRPATYAARSSVEGINLEVDRKGLVSLVEAVAEDDRDVAGATVGLRRRVIRVRLDAFPDVDLQAVRDRVHDQTKAVVDASALERGIKVAVSTNSSDRRAR